tara:strand:+ start:291 stop:752 length:462 start_codon:yes stop_codon:yes gene_type:complete
VHPGNVINVSGGLLDQRNLTEQIIEHCIDQLLPRHRSLWIEVELKKIYPKENAVGYCQDDGGNMFTIEIDKMQNLYDFILTICHEMVHVKQNVRRELTERGLRHYWYGQLHTDRRNEPWELEAWKLQKKLANSFIRQETNWLVKDIKQLDKRL